MGIVHADITLKNANDMAIAASGLVEDYAIRQTTVNALVDAGAWTLVINEATREELGLQITSRDFGTLADGTQSVYNMTSPVEINWKDRRAICEALVLPEAKEILLGAVPLEIMDLMVHPVKEEVVGAHGDQIMHLIV